MCVLLWLNIHKHTACLSHLACVCLCELPQVGFKVSHEWWWSHYKPLLPGIILYRAPLWYPTLSSSACLMSPNCLLLQISCCKIGKLKLTHWEGCCPSQKKPTLQQESLCTQCSNWPLVEFWKMQYQTSWGSLERMELQNKRKVMSWHPASSWFCPVLSSVTACLSGWSQVHIGLSEA